MLVIQSLPWVIVLMVVGMILLGTWPALWNRVERHGRIPSHTFLDYTLGYLVVALATSFTLGQIGPPYDGRPNFFEQLSQPNGPMVGFAAAGGVCLAFGDIAMQYAVAFLGLSVGPPILNAMTIIIGTILSYFLDGGINKGYLVFPGLACAAVAIGLGALSHLISPATKEQKLKHSLSRQQKQQRQTAKDQQHQIEQEEKAELGLQEHQQHEEQQAIDAPQLGGSTSMLPHLAVRHRVHLPASQPEEEDCALSIRDNGGASNHSSILTSAPAAASKDIELSKAVGVRERQVHQQDKEQQSMQMQRSIGRADTSIYLGLTIAVAGECGFAYYGWFSGLVLQCQMQCLGPSHWP